MTNTVTVTESNNSVTVTEQNNTVSILEDAPVVTADPWYTGITTLATSSGSVTVTADTAAHTKGAWTEVIASNAADTSALFIFPQNTIVQGGFSGTLLDIGTGAAGSETVVAGNIAIGGLVSLNYLGVSCVAPIKVTNGTRIAARIQSIVTGGKTASVKLQTLAWGDASTVPTSVDVLGTSTATSAGTNVNTSYTEVVASTAQDYKAIILLPSYSGNNAGNFDITLSIATGSSGNETEIATYGVREVSAEYVGAFQMPSTITEVTIPAGTRLSVKTDTSDIWVTLIGVPAA